MMRASEAAYDAKNKLMKIAKSLKICARDAAGLKAGFHASSPAMP